ncbi:MAG: hypothetical protein R3B84_00110 [Zavarzinella sp.]
MMHLIMLTSLVLGATPPEITKPVLEKGLEIRWVGTFTEAGLLPSVRTVRKYQVDTRVFVINVDEQGATVAIMNRIEMEADRSQRPGASVVRLDLGHISPKGVLSRIPSPADPDAKEQEKAPWPSVPLDGLPIYEGGMFFPLPVDVVKFASAWETKEPGRPTKKWRVTDLASIRALPGLQITMDQQTEGFQNAQVYKPEWSISETHAVLPAQGFSSRWTRVFERREARTDAITFRATLEMEQKNSLVYPGRFYTERKTECVFAAAFTAMLDRHLAEGGRGGFAPFESLVRRIDGYTRTHFESDVLPYREAIVAVRKRAESAAKGHIPPSADAPTPNQQLVVGAAPPDVPLTGINHIGREKLADYRGQRTLVVYFQPHASSASGVLTLIKRLNDQKDVKVIPLAIGTKEQVLKLLAEEKSDCPIYDGSTTYQTHGLTSTPVFVLIGENHKVEQIIPGWGSKTVQQLLSSIEQASKTAQNK